MPGSICFIGHSWRCRFSSLVTRWQFMATSGIRLLTGMKAALIAVATLTIATQAQASVFQDKFIDAMMECMSYSSQMNCDKAEGAAELYARSLRNNPAAEKCALKVQVAGGQASIIPMLPSAVSSEII